MGVAGGRQNGNMTQGLLDFLQVNPCLKHMGCETVAQRMAGDLLFDAKLFNNFSHCGLDTTSINGAIGSVGIFGAVLAAWKDEKIMVMGQPE